VIGGSLRLRLFLALSGAAFVGALTTGLYAVLVDPVAIGFVARTASVTPKAFLLLAVLLPMIALGAAALGKALARPVENVADVAVRVAQGEGLPPMRYGGAVEAYRISQALGSLRREIDRAPYAAAVLRDAWHDLRNPLAAVRASLELLEAGGLAPVEAAHFTANAARSAEELDRRFEALVTLSRFETAALALPTPVSMGGLIRGAVERARPLAEARNVRLSTNVRPSSAAGERDSVVGDANALERAFSNLIQNACAATPRGSVRVLCDDGAPCSVTVDVVNEPAQIPERVRPFLFGRVPASFSRGTGLGLAIARAAVEAHGGRVSFVEWGPPRVRVRVELPR
jgi:two-component system, OmpR family, sensor histidine kinase CreC